MPRKRLSPGEKNENIQIRTTDEIKKNLTEKAIKSGFSNLSEFMLFVALNVDIKVSIKNKKVAL